MKARTLVLSFGATGINVAWGNWGFATFFGLISLLAIGITISEART